MNNNNTEDHYRTFARNVQLLIDEGFAEKVIPVNGSVRLLDQIVEEVDMKPLERALGQSADFVANCEASSDRLAPVRNPRS